MTKGIKIDIETKIISTQHTPIFEFTKKFQRLAKKLCLKVVDYISSNIV